VSRTHGSKDFWLAALRADAAGFRHAVGQPGVLGAAVPTCPGWTVTDLVRHLGSVYRRTTNRVATGNADESWGPIVVPDGTPGDEQVVAWFDNEFAAMDATLDGLDPDLPAWNWAPQARTATFWFRRMSHETAVHRWDAHLATGLLPEPLESKLASDTVAEALDTFLPAGRRRTPGEVTGMIHLLASDVGQEWYVRLRGEGVALLDTDTLLDDDSHPARATATGTASDLALALWSRVSFDVVDTAGELDLLKALRVA
jgi:uncharacterized protein (TIGR03083 family)